MINIGIIGANGFLGSELVNILSTNYNICKITKESKYNFANRYFNIIINANGNSSKQWAIKYPYKDFLASVDSVYRTLDLFKYDAYIYISSYDVYKHNVYGIHKKMAEEIIKHNTKKHLILRCSSIIGKNMKKGVIKNYSFPLTLNFNL